MEDRKGRDVGNTVTIEDCLRYQSLGVACEWNDGRYLTLVGKEKDLPSGNLERSKGNKNISNKSVAQKSSAIKHNYSVVCRRCGRKLNSEESRNRGYGSYCYRRAQKDLLKEAAENETEDINFLNELKGVM